MKKVYLFLLISCCVESIYSQVVTIDFPQQARKKMVIGLKQGTKLDTIYNGFLDNQGKAQINFALSQKEYHGMARVSLEEGAGFDFIFSSIESPTFFSKEEYPHEGNVSFSNSPENQLLRRWFASQAIRMQKIGVLKEAQRLYESEKRFLPHLAAEIKTLEEEQRFFSDSLKTSPLYVARFMELHNFLIKNVATLLSANSTQMAETRSFVQKDLDVESLFTSGLWFEVLNGLLTMYDNEAPYHKDFINDMTLLLKRSKKDTTYTTLAENLFTICEATGWNDLEEQLAYFLINDERIKHPNGKLQTLKEVYKITKGNKVPELKQGVIPEGKRVIVFYETGCNSCENEMLALKANYKLIKEKGYEVVSISSDTDQDVFSNTAQNFPWTYKYCDFKGLLGDDFKSYGVIGTPTFYIVNEESVVQGRYARLQDTGLLN